MQRNTERKRNEHTHIIYSHVNLYTHAARAYTYGYTHIHTYILVYTNIHIIIT